MLTRIYLIRHGQTDLNKSKTFRGRLDPPLNEIGFKEADTAATFLKYSNISFVISSPLLRAVQTGERIARCHGLEVATMPEFVDVDFGDWEGMTEEKVATLYPQLLSLWHNSPHKVKFPGGENLLDVKKRVKKGLDKIRENYNGQNGALVTHRVVCKVLICLLAGIPLKNFWSIRIDTAGISLFDMMTDHFTIHFLNSTSHLSKMESRITHDF